MPSVSLASVEQLLILAYEDDYSNVMPLASPGILTAVKVLVAECVNEALSEEQRERAYKEITGIVKRCGTPAVKGDTRVALDTLFVPALMPLLCWSVKHPQIQMVSKALMSHLAHNNVYPRLLAILDAHYATDNVDGPILDAFIAACVPAIKALVSILVRCGVDALRELLARISASVSKTVSSRGKKRKAQDTMDALDAPEAETPEGNETTTETLDA